MNSPSQNNSIHNDIFECRLVKEGSRDDQEGIEPASSLIRTFSNEICWEALLKRLHILEWIVQLQVNNFISYIIMIVE